MGHRIADILAHSSLQHKNCIGIVVVYHFYDPVIVENSSADSALAKLFAIHHKVLHVEEKNSVTEDPKTTLENLVCQVIV